MHCSRRFFLNFKSPYSLFSLLIELSWTCMTGRSTFDSPPNVFACVLGWAPHTVIILCNKFGYTDLVTREVPPNISPEQRPNND